MLLDALGLVKIGLGTVLQRLLKVPVELRCYLTLVVT